MRASLEQSRNFYVENNEDAKQVFYKPKHPRVRRRQYTNISTFMHYNFCPEYKRLFQRDSNVDR